MTILAEFKYNAGVKCLNHLTVCLFHALFIDVIIIWLSTSLQCYGSLVLILIALTS
jgi:hypothetical protein